MYVWGENEASRGSQEIGSCMLVHLREHVDDSIRKIFIYSDCCGGQNRNIKMSSILKHFLMNSNVDSIRHKFFVSGHSYNRCDTCFASIEKQKKLHEVVPTVDHWIEIIENARVKNKFIVMKIDKLDFKSTIELEHLISNRKKDTNKENINWLKTSTLTYEKEKAFIIYMTNDGKNVQELNIQKRHVTAEMMKNADLPLLFLFGKEITKAKYNDLQELEAYIPPEYHSFHDNLTYDDDGENDFGLVSDNSDDE